MPRKRKPTPDIPSNRDTTTEHDDNYGAILKVTKRDKEMRLAHESYSREEAQPWQQLHLSRMLDSWHAWNRRFYEGKLLVPHLRLCEPSSSRVLGSTHQVGGIGEKLEIRLRPSILTGTHKDMRPEDAFAEGRFLFLEDVALHEVIHQYHMEVTGTIEKSYHGHGPAFRDLCNMIGAELGLSPVRSSKKRGEDASLPSCAQWPHNVRDPAYYQGAYIVPVEGDTTPVDTPPEIDVDAVIALLFTGQAAIAPLIERARSGKTLGALATSSECMRQALLLLGAEEEEEQHSRAA